VIALDSKRIVGLVLLDLSAAFDTVDHDTLLSVLHRRFGVCDHALSWVRWYLSDRSQVPFEWSTVWFGRGQQQCTARLCARADHVYFLHGRRQSAHYSSDIRSDIICTPTTNRFTPTYLSRTSALPDACSGIVSDVANWCSSRRLQLNASKSELIWFGSKFSLKQLTENDLTLALDSGPIHPVSVVRDLGVMLDCELSMKQHVTKVASS